MADLDEVIKSRVDEIRRLSKDNQGSTAWFEAANLALSVLHDTVGRSHSLMFGIRDALSKADYHRAVAAARAVITLPSSSIAVITASDNKQITAWGDVRNKADHGKLSQLTHSEVLATVIGVRGFLDRHMP
jgi:hypothetical protein